MIQLPRLFSCSSSSAVAVHESNRKSKLSEVSSSSSSPIPKPLQALPDLAPKAVQKNLQQIMLKPHPHWVGTGFHVLPVFDEKAFTEATSPFLMFDYAAPKHFAPSQRKLGVGKHPHRGMETVTIAWQGEVEHGDHLGNRDVIRAGDVQWMTAGRGIVHEEHHSSEFAKKGGTFEMCQLWVNLPSRHKMAPASYQAISGGKIPAADLPGGVGRVRVIAGDFCGLPGPSRTFTPIDMWEVLLDKAGKSTDLIFPEGHNTIIFVKRGAAVVGGERSKLNEQDLALLGTRGRQVLVGALKDNTELLILSGEPIAEAIAASGPFVMNTREELSQAYQDYSNGTNGFGGTKR